MNPAPTAQTEAQSDDDVDVSSVARWAREWLNEVGEARKALERAAMVAELRESRAFALPNPLAYAGGGVVRGGIRDGMKAVDDMIDGEGAEDSLEWARDALALFDLMAKVNRATLRGAMLSGLDIAELRYALGDSDNQICSAFAISRSKLHNDLNAFIDYLDYLGPERAFNVTQPVEDATIRGDVDAATNDDGHARVYEHIASMCRTG